MKHLYFVRHGLSVMNKRGIYSGRTETPLAPEGITQAQEAGKALKGLSIDLIVSSPLERARETAALIAQQIGYPIAEIHLNELFTERNFGVLEGTPYTPDRAIEHHKGVEPDEEILARARKGIDYLKTLRHDNILVVGHGSIGRAMRHILEPSLHFHDMEGIKNAEIVQLL